MLEHILQNVQNELTAAKSSKWVIQGGPATYASLNLCTEVLGELLQSSLVFTDEWKRFEESFDGSRICGANS